MKTPQTDIKVFLTDEVNIEIYNTIEPYSITGMINPLEFFNSLFYEFEFFNKNVNDYIKIKEHFKTYSDFSLFMESGSEETLFFNKFYLFDALKKLIQKHISIENRIGITLKSCEHIENIFNDLCSYLKKNYANNPITFETIQEEIKDLDIDDKIQYLVNLKHDKLQEWEQWSNDDFLGSIVKKFNENESIHPIVKICDIEINRLTRIKKAKKSLQPQQNELIPKPNDLQIRQTNLTTSNTLNWHGSQLEFTELLQALFLSKKIGVGLDRFVVFERLRNFFNIEKFDEKDKIREIKNRRKDNAKFINLLETNINNWIES